MRVVHCRNCDKQFFCQEKNILPFNLNEQFLSNRTGDIIFVDALGKHPLCHRMCKVTKETSGANNIMRNAIDSTSITFRWTSRHFE